MAEEKEIILASKKQGLEIIDAMEDFLLAVDDFDKHCISIWDISPDDKNLKKKIRSYGISSK